MQYLMKHSGSLHAYYEHVCFTWRLKILVSSNVQHGNLLLHLRLIFPYRNYSFSNYKILSFFFSLSCTGDLILVLHYLWYQEPIKIKVCTDWKLIEKKKRTKNKNKINAQFNKQTIKQQHQNNTNSAFSRAHSLSAEENSTCILMHVLYEMRLYVMGYSKFNQLKKIWKKIWQSSDNSFLHISYVRTNLNIFQT